MTTNAIQHLESAARVLADTVVELHNLDASVGETPTEAQQALWDTLTERADQVLADAVLTQELTPLALMAASAAMDHQGRILTPADDGHGEWTGPNDGLPPTGELLAQGRRFVLGREGRWAEVPVNAEADAVAKVRQAMAQADAEDPVLTPTGACLVMQHVLDLVTDCQVHHDPDGTLGAGGLYGMLGRAGQACPLARRAPKGYYGQHLIQFLPVTGRPGAWADTLLDRRQAETESVLATLYDGATDVRILGALSLDAALALSVDPQRLFQIAWQSQEELAWVQAVDTQALGLVTRPDDLEPDQDRHVLVVAVMRVSDTGTFDTDGVPPDAQVERLDGGLRDLGLDERWVDVDPPMDLRRAVAGLLAQRWAHALDLRTTDDTVALCEVSEAMQRHLQSGRAGERPDDGVDDDTVSGWLAAVGVFPNEHRSRDLMMVPSVPVYFLADVLAMALRDDLNVDLRLDLPLTDVLSLTPQARLVTPRGENEDDDDSMPALDSMVPPKRTLH